jgi:protease-4
MVFLLLALGGSVLMNVALFSLYYGGNLLETDGRVQEQFISHQSSARDKIAVISVEGVILEEDGFVKREIDRAAHDANVKGVVLRVESPGGTVTASDYLYHHLGELREKSKIPIVVSMGGIAASGGYYLSMAVGDKPDTIFAEPTTWTGSIGVVIPHYNFAELMKTWGVMDDSIASHRLKTMGSFTKPMTEEERQIFQTLVDESFTQFKNIVKSGRPKFRKDPAALDKLATGQVFTADQALKAGLIDKIGYLDAAVDRAIQLAGVSADNVRVVKYKREITLASMFLEGQSESRSFDLAKMLDLAAPRAWFLWTTVPPLATARSKQ